MKKMLNGFVSKLIGGVLATSLATAGLVGLSSRNPAYNYNPDKTTAKTDISTQELVSAIRDSVYCRYSLQDDSLSNKCSEQISKLAAIKKKLGIRDGDIKTYLKSKGILHANYPSSDSKRPLESCYIAMIVDKFNKNGTTFYLTKLNEMNFQGVDTYEGWHLKRGFIGGFRDLDKRNAINIELDPIENDAEKVDNNWEDYVVNNEYLNSGDNRWDPVKQSIFNTLKDIPASIRKKEYLNQAIYGSIFHELKHLKDKDNGSNSKYNKIDRETRAYLEELQHTSLELNTLERILAIKNPNNSDKEYMLAAEKIMKGFLDYRDIKSKKDFYKLSNEQIKIRAKVLYNQFYSD